jgi:hypothetical protein
MATEFDWAGDADVVTATLRDFIATATGGAQSQDGTIHLDGMYVTARAGPESDSTPAIALFGFGERFTATYRFANLADEETTDHNTALMVHAVIAFAQRYGGNGVLLFNGEEAVLQYGPGGIVFASDWEDWTENGEVAPLLDQFDSRSLPQPLL